MLDDSLVLRMAYLSRLLNQPIEKLSTMLGCPSVESECVLVQIIVQMIMTDCSLMGSHQPPFHKRSGPVYPGHQFRSRLFLPFQNRHFVFIASRFKTVVSIPSISMNGTPRFNNLSDKCVKAIGGCIGNSLHPNAPSAFSIFLRSNDYQSFALNLPSAQSFFKTPDVCFVNLDNTRKFVPTGSNHGPAKFVQHQPCGFVAAQPQNPFQTKRTCTIFLAGHPPHCSKPNWQRQMGTVEYRSRSNRNLMTTFFALVQGFSNCCSIFPVTLWADKSVRPPERKKIVSAPRHATKSRFKFHQIPGIILHALNTTCCAVLSQVDTPNTGYLPFVMF